MKKGALFSSAGPAVGGITLCIALNVILPHPLSRQVLSSAAIAGGFRLSQSASYPVSFRAFQKPNPAVDRVRFAHWTLRDEAAQRRSPPRYAS